MKVALVEDQLMFRSMLRRLIVTDCKGRVALEGALERGGGLDVALRGVGGLALRACSVGGAQLRLTLLVVPGRRRLRLVASLGAGLEREEPGRRAGEPERKKNRARHRHRAKLRSP